MNECIKFIINFCFAFGQMTIADISIVTIVSTVDMILPVTVDAWPKLHHWWYKEMKTLPHYEKANAGLAALKAWTQQSTDFQINMWSIHPEPISIRLNGAHQTSGIYLVWRGKLNASIAN